MATCVVVAPITLTEIRLTGTARPGSVAVRVTVPGGTLRKYARPLVTEAVGHASGPASMAPSASRAGSRTLIATSTPVPGEPRQSYAPTPTVPRPASYPAPLAPLSTCCADCVCRAMPTDVFGVKLSSIEKDGWLIGNAQYVNVGK